MTLGVVRPYAPVTLLELKRRQTEMSQEQLAEKFRADGGKGSNGTVAAWLRGDRTPDLHSAHILSQIINDHLPEDEEEIRIDPFFLAPVGSKDGAGIAKITGEATPNAYLTQEGRKQVA